ncbi:MAG: hypothetical protein ACOC8N_06050 [Spirochaetota bacterium]
MLLVYGILGGALALLLLRAAAVWRDASRPGVPPGTRLLWCIAGGVVPSLYWWKYRLPLLSPEQKARIMERETAALDVGSPDSLACPLCGREIPRAWAIDRHGRLTVARRPAACPRCDFRLDSCRFCGHFMPGERGSWGQVGFGESDITFGRCEVYRKEMPVEEACRGTVAEQFRRRGIAFIRGELPIADSYFPPDTCRSFALDRRRVRAGDIPWPNRRRRVLIRMAGEVPAEHTAGGAQGEGAGEETGPGEPPSPRGGAPSRMDGGP